MVLSSQPDEGLLLLEMKVRVEDSCGWVMWLSRVKLIEWQCIDSHKAYTCFIFKSRDRYITVILAWGVSALAGTLNV